MAKAFRKARFDPKRILRVGYKRNSLDIDSAVSGLLEHKDKIKAVVMIPTYRQAAAFIKRIMDGGMNPIFASVSLVGSDALAEELKELGPKYSDGVIVTEVVPFYGSAARGSWNTASGWRVTFPAEQPGLVSLEGYIAAQSPLCGTGKSRTRPDHGEARGRMETIQGLDFGIGTKITFGPPSTRPPTRCGPLLWTAKANSDSRPGLGLFMVADETLLRARK